MRPEDKICILGLGYIGLTIAAVLAEKGYEINGVDVLPDVIESLKKKGSYFFEPGLQQLISEYSNKNLKYFTEIPDQSCNYYIICVGTPIEQNKLRPNLSYLKNAVASLIPVIKSDDTVIFRSTVPVGTTRQLVMNILEKETKLIAGKDIHIGFVPERTVEGNAVAEVKSIPQIIGSFDEESRDKIKKVFSSFNEKIIDVPDIEHAELCKLIDNTYRDVIFSYANQMAIISESLGLDYNVIRNAVNKDYRRNDIPRASPGVGGACLTKDPFILADLCKKLDIDASLILSARHINKKVVHMLAEKIAKRLKSLGRNIKSAKIFIMGLAFKGNPETSDIRFSTSIDLINYLKPLCENIYGFDRIAISRDLDKLGITICDIEEGFINADVVVIMNSHRSHIDLNIKKLSNKSNIPLLFIDCWNLYDKDKIESLGNVIYSSVGLY